LPDLRDFRGRLGPLELPDRLELLVPREPRAHLVRTLLWLSCG